MKAQKGRSQYTDYTNTQDLLVKGTLDSVIKATEVINDSYKGHAAGLLRQGDSRVMNTYRKNKNAIDFLKQQRDHLDN
ncbi:hypothetical protein [Bacillus thuringiensis]|uniref:hypothetical protein n=1 Tax=Bacillus thuringiensis TaxID=1428 RepID=UPI000BF67F36|nr:hypothetical protein [Bacillus thuringiensis]PFJ53312.1 hypothetical protein COJ02_21200 [Bacillus thuringiensis]PFR42518.1 hypothetical protein COK27_10890 [Bacillus thuringiensis]PGL25989.1 hypothetical protein CN921_11830 [Bacillus thuringiensis]